MKFWVVANTSKSWPSRLFSPNKNGCHWVWLLFAICLFCFVFFTFCLFFQNVNGATVKYQVSLSVLFKLCVCDLITMLDINSEVFFSCIFFFARFATFKESYVVLRASFFCDGNTFLVHCSGKSEMCSSILKNRMRV